MQEKRERVRARVSGRASCMCMCISCKGGLGSGFEKRVGKFVGFLFLPSFGVGVGVHEMVLLRGVGWVEKATPIFAHPYPNPQLPPLRPQIHFSTLAFLRRKWTLSETSTCCIKMCGFQRTSWEQKLKQK